MNDWTFSYCGAPGMSAARALIEKDMGQMGEPEEDTLQIAKFKAQKSEIKFQKMSRRSYLKAWDRSLIKLANSDPRAYERRLDTLQAEYLASQKEDK